MVNFTQKFETAQKNPGLSISIDPLYPGTKYHFEVFAVTGGGNGTRAVLEKEIAVSGIKFFRNWYDICKLSRVHKLSTKVRKMSDRNLLIIKMIVMPGNSLSEKTFLHPAHLLRNK